MRLERLLTSAVELLDDLSDSFFQATNNLGITNVGNNTQLLNTLDAFHQSLPSFAPNEQRFFSNPVLNSAFQFEEIPAALQLKYSDRSEIPVNTQAEETNGTEQNEQAEEAELADLKEQYDIINNSLSLNIYIMKRECLMLYDVMNATFNLETEETGHIIASFIQLTALLDAFESPEKQTNSYKYSHLASLDELAEVLLLLFNSESGTFLAFEDYIKAEDTKKQQAPVPQEEDEEQKVQTELNKQFLEIMQKARGSYSIITDQIMGLTQNLPPLPAKEFQDLMTLYEQFDFYQRKEPKTVLNPIKEQINKLISLIKKEELEKDEIDWGQSETFKIESYTSNELVRSIKELILSIEAHLDYGLIKRSKTRSYLFNIRKTLLQAGDKLNTIHHSSFPLNVCTTTELLKRLTKKMASFSIANENWKHLCEQNQNNPLQNRAHLFTTFPPEQKTTREINQGNTNTAPQPLPQEDENTPLMNGQFLRFGGSLSGIPWIHRDPQEILQALDSTSLYELPGNNLSAQLSHIANAAAGAKLEMRHSSELSSLHLSLASSFSLSPSSNDVGCQLEVLSGVHIQKDNENAETGVASFIELNVSSRIGRPVWSAIQALNLHNIGDGTFNTQPLASAQDINLTASRPIRLEWSSPDMYSFRFACINTFLSFSHFAGQMLGGSLGATVLMPSYGAAVGGALGAGSAALTLSLIPGCRPRVTRTPLSGVDMETQAIGLTASAFANPHLSLNTELSYGVCKKRESDLIQNEGASENERTSQNEIATQNERAPQNESAPQ